MPRALVVGSGDGALTPHQLLADYGLPTPAGVTRLHAMRVNQLVPAVVVQLTPRSASSSVRPSRTRPTWPSSTWRPALEFDLLTHLAAAPRHTFSRGDLLFEVWHSSPDWQSVKTVTEHVRRVRVKIESDPAQPRWIGQSQAPVTGSNLDR